MGRVDRATPSLSQAGAVAPMSAEHVCARCAARGTSCCISVEGIPGPALTLGDRDRVRAASGRPDAELFEHEPLDALDVAVWEEEDPTLRGLGRDGGVVRLRRPGGACVLLGPHGCTLDAETRPLLCRRFPLVRLGGKLRVRAADGCLAAEESSSVDAILAAIGETRGSLSAIERQLRRELGENAP